MRREVHVALRRLEIGVACPLLNCPHRHAAHRQVGAEGVPELVEIPRFRQPSPLARHLEPALERRHLDRRPVGLPEEALAAEMADGVHGRTQPRGKRDPTALTSLRSTNLTFPVVPYD